MTFEDVKRQREQQEKRLVCHSATRWRQQHLHHCLPVSSSPSSPSSAQSKLSSSSSCFSSNLQKAPPTSSTVLNNQCEKDTTAAVKDGRDFKRVHFSLETLNTRRLLTRLGGTHAKEGGAKADSGGRCENGGPPAPQPPPPSLASLLRSLPSAPPTTASSSQSRDTPAAIAPPPATVAPPRPGELQQLQQEIDEMRERLRAALARRAELQSTVATPTSRVELQTTVATVSATPVPPNTTAAPATPLPADTRCVTTMTDMTQVPPPQNRPANQRS